MHTRGADDVAEATGPTSSREKDPAAVARGRLGGRARAKNTPPEVRSNDAREAVNARWAAERARRKAASRVGNPIGCTTRGDRAPPRNGTVGSSLCALQTLCATASKR